MAEKRIGVAVTAAASNTALAAIEDLEKQGFNAACMTSGSASGGDSLSVFAAAAWNTDREGYEGAVKGLLRRLTP